MSTEYEKMIAGDFYKPSDPKLRALAASSREKQWAFNAEPDRLKRAEIVTNRDRTDIQHGQIPVRVKIFTDMDINTVIRNELRIHGNIL